MKLLIVQHIRMLVFRTGRPNCHPEFRRGSQYEHVMTVGWDESSIDYSPSGPTVARTVPIQPFLNISEKNSIIYLQWTLCYHYLGIIAFAWEILKVSGTFVFVFFFWTRNGSHRLSLLTVFFVFLLFLLCQLWDSLLQSLSPVVSKRIEIKFCTVVRREHSYDWRYSQVSRLYKHMHPYITCWKHLYL